MPRSATRAERNRLQPRAQDDERTTWRRGDGRRRRELGHAAVQEATDPVRLRRAARTRRNCVVTWRRVVSERRSSRSQAATACSTALRIARRSFVPIAPIDSTKISRSHAACGTSSGNPSQRLPEQPVRAPAMRRVGGFARGPGPLAQGKKRRSPRGVPLQPPVARVDVGARQKRRSPRGLRRNGRGEAGYLTDFLRSRPIVRWCWSVGRVFCANAAISGSSLFAAFSNSFTFSS